MKRIGFVVAILAGVFGGLALNLRVAFAEERFEVQNSSFNKVFFVISGNGAFTDDITQKGRQDAIDSFRDYSYKNEAPGQLMVCFQNVSQDEQTFVPYNRICIIEGALHIRVAEKTKGMFITYSRIDKKSPDFIILTVPSEESKEAWREAATKARMNYLAAFYKQKSELMEFDIEKLQREAAEKLDKEEPRVIYPK